MTQKYKSLAVHLKQDVALGIKLSTSSAESGDEICPELYHEALELLLNIATIREVHPICDAAQINTDFL